jgi:hypothetical protein
MKRSKREESYLEQQVAGNDLDPYAAMVTQLRYVLASESLGDAVTLSLPI